MPQSHCVVRYKQFINNTAKLICDLCKACSHSVCVGKTDSDIGTTWVCNICFVNELPFNHIVHDDEFTDAINEYQQLSIPISLEQLNDLIFDPFDLNEECYDYNVEDQEYLSHGMCKLSCRYYNPDDEVKIHADGEMSFSLMHFNIRSVPKHYHEFTLFLECISDTFAVIGLSETWFTTSNVDCYKFVGYNIVNDTRINRPGGGASLLVNTNISYKVRGDLNRFSSLVECVVIEIEKSTFLYEHNVIIGNVYRPPNTDIKPFTENVLEVLLIIQSENKRAYIMGDYNINLLNTGKHLQTSEFIDTMLGMGYIPLINKPTRVQAKTATLIDNIFTNDMQCIDSLSGIYVTDISDHYPIFHVCAKRLTSNTGTVTKRQFNESNIARFCTQLKSHDWSQLYATQDVETSYTYFDSTFKTYFDVCFPFKTYNLDSYSMKKNYG